MLDMLLKKQVSVELADGRLLEGELSFWNFRYIVTLDNGKRVSFRKSDVANIKKGIGTLHVAPREMYIKGMFDVGSKYGRYYHDLNEYRLLLIRYYEVLQQIRKIKDEVDQMSYEDYEKMVLKKHRNPRFERAMRKKRKEQMEKESLENARDC